MYQNLALRWWNLTDVELSHIMSVWVTQKSVQNLLRIVVPYTDTWPSKTPTPMRLAQRRLNTAQVKKYACTCTVHHSTPQHLILLNKSFHASMHHKNCSRTYLCDLLEASKAKIAETFSWSSADSPTFPNAKKFKYTTNVMKHEYLHWNINKYNKKQDYWKFNLISKYFISSTVHVHLLKTIPQTYSILRGWIKRAPSSILAI